MPEQRAAGPTSSHWHTCLCETRIIQNTLTLLLCSSSETSVDTANTVESNLEFRVTVASPSNALRLDCSKTVIVGSNPAPGMSVVCFSLLCCYVLVDAFRPVDSLSEESYHTFGQGYLFCVPLHLFLCLFLTYSSQ